MARSATGCGRSPPTCTPATPPIRGGPSGGSPCWCWSPPASPDAVAPPLRDLPDSPVLGPGGTLGEAWMRGVLTGARAAGGADMRRCEYFVGTSAGSIVAATLAAGREPEAGDRAAQEWSRAAPADDAAGEDGAGGGLAAALAGV